MNNETQQLFSLNPGVVQPSISIQRLLEIPNTAPINLQDVEDFSNVCRACATITEFIIPIFSGEGLQYNLAEKINKHMPIQVSETDPLPHVFCYQCASQLLAWHERVLCCVQADAALRARIAADSNEVNNKDTKPTNFRTNTNIQEDSQSQFTNISDYVAQSMSLPQYVGRLRVCHPRHAPPHYREHLLSVHGHRGFYSQERKNIVSHIPQHVLNYTLKIKKEIKKNKKVKIKIDTSVNNNNNVTPPTITPTSEMTLVSAPELQDPEASKPGNNNEFFDHSDTESGFGPLPESVFEAIEDSQDSQPAEDNMSPENETVSDEPSSETIKKPHKKSRTCPICSKVYTASSSYFYHMKYTHKQIKEHECTICSKKFATRASLATHITTHTGECQYECKECNKRFKSKASVYIHEQIHNGIKTWSCNQCSASFRWKTHLLRHMKRHSNERTHICATCGRGFSVRCDLLRHARTHIAGNFTCDKCDIKFAQLRYLKAHMDKKHSVKTKGS